VLVARAENLQISQEGQKDRRSEGDKNAFFNSEDRIEKYSSEVQKQKMGGFAKAGGSANPKFSAFCPSVLPVKISIVRGGLDPPRKLLRFGLQFGSTRRDEIPRWHH
jgi:hypothetical protein